VEPNVKNANGDTAGHIVMRKGVRRHWRRAGSWFIAEGLTPYVRTDTVVASASANSIA
jgi:hypothetical protein